MSFFKPRTPNHNWLWENKISPINGDAPYFHVSDTIFNAIKEVDGFSPSILNPFANIEYVNDLIQNKEYKFAYGYSGIIETTPIPYIITVNIEMGICSYGTYSGSIGFSLPPSIGLSVFTYTGDEDESHGFVTQIIGLTNKMFNISVLHYGTDIYRVSYLIIGR